ncbi:DJ-1/YajL/PfpI superfamily, includes chaperone protein YajL (former ThiJ), parkinsonism-associated protein DJ-1, peptidases PfpI, Hsp31 [hydrothermal vent metagenome]|uniref:DJ-1/YajL/PfpI superfamily, includes chaperone protein YajL (Former ThiJ), parkinsonism-associated protein DJ-1, peptidases PfpI, Hsp31 n=1 Tax=hydrothermal vent metagenome TaxID=652676 RepID=A0A3B0ZWH8_9ZZZZ
MARPRILVPLAQGCEELEAVTITDLLTRAEFEVVTAGLDDQPVTASRGMVLVPSTTMQSIMSEDFDMMVLPGGLPGAEHLRDNPLVQQKLKELAAEDKYVAAICAAPQALASAGLLDNKIATGYTGVLDKLDIPGMQISELPLVVDGKVITSQGPGTAMDFALKLIEIIAGTEKRIQVEQPLLRSAV